MATIIDRDRVKGGLAALVLFLTEKGDPISIEQADICADALTVLNEQEPTKWISVKDRLPEEHDSMFANFTHLSKHMWAKESDNVIVYVRFPDGTGRSTEGRLQDGKWWTRISPTLEPVVTHWQPLPEQPKEVSANE